MSKEEKLMTALRNAAQILGPFPMIFHCENKCSGCQQEMIEAYDIAITALGWSRKKAQKILWPGTGKKSARWPSSPKFPHNETKESS